MFVAGQASRTQTRNHREPTLRLPIGFVMLAASGSALAAGQGELETIIHTALQMVLVLLILATTLVAARWLYDSRQRRKATRAARAVKEPVAPGQKPYRPSYAPGRGRRSWAPEPDTALVKASKDRRKTQ